MRWLYADKNWCAVDENGNVNTRMMIVEAGTPAHFYPMWNDWRRAAWDLGNYHNHGLKGNKIPIIKAPTP